MKRQVVRPRPPPLPKTAKGNWFERNWKWVVPIVGGLLILLSTVVATMSVGRLMRSSVPYKDAVTFARENESVTDALGTPIREGLFVSGRINTIDDAGCANLSIPLSGPKASGTFYVSATRSEGQWTCDRVVLVIKATGERIDLGAPNHRGQRKFEPGRAKDYKQA